MTMTYKLFQNTCITDDDDDDDDDDANDDDDPQKLLTAMYQMKHLFIPSFSKWQTPVGA